MRKEAISVALIILFVLAVASATGNQDISESFKELTSEFFAHVEKSEFELAAALFHYPPTYTSKERSHDADCVTRTLALFADEFGAPKSPRASESSAQFWTVGAMGGDIPYWEAHPVFVQSLHDVTFSKEGAGFVELQFCKMKTKWEIRGVLYGLPAQRPGSRERVAEIAEKLLQIMKPFVKEAEAVNDGKEI